MRAITIERPRLRIAIATQSNPKHPFPTRGELPAQRRTFGRNARGIGVYRAQ